ncbi:MAG TPA: type VI secretion system baseplate subunit TssG [Bryobacteraceae bacterium]|nr:type VI secretion system baseplate subunit TssG [Bryobacteraceae bacterium]
MATPGGTDNLDVIRRYARVGEILRETPHRFQFFQAVRLIERLLPDRAPVGRFVSPDKEVMRFAAHSSFRFPASQIQNILWDGDVPVLVVNFMGLTGPMGVLPLYYTELIIDRLRNRDRAMAEFFDLFNHRMISLFYQAWEKYRFTIAYERGERDRFSHHLMDLIGIGTSNLDKRLRVEDDSLLFYSGLLSLRPRSAAAVQRILEDYFDVPVAVEQFTGAWFRLSAKDLCVFDRASTESEQLGGGAIVGDEIWHQQSGVRLHIGPMPLEKYLDFLPTGSAYEPLRSLAEFAGRGELDFEVRLILKQDEVPACELGKPGEDAEAPRLGWTSWAKTEPMRADAGDTILTI